MSVPGLGLLLIAAGMAVQFFGGREQLGFALVGFGFATIVAPYVDRIVTRVTACARRRS